MNVLEICLSSDFGGLEMAMRDFAVWVHAQPDCRLHLALRRNCRLADALADSNAPALIFDGKGGHLPAVKALRLARFIERRAIDVVHLHWKYDLPLVALAKRLCRRPFAVAHTRHMNLPGRKHDPWHRYIYGALDAFIGVTDYLADQARANLPLPAERIFRVHNGCAVPEPVPPERVTANRRELGVGDAFSVALLGRVSRFKGQHLLIEAVDLLRAEGRTVHGWIIGEPFHPDYLTELKTMAAERGLGDHIRFRGFHENPGEIYPCFDALALTTKNETFGLVLIEAMHAGVPVIGSREGGVPEIIDHEVNGLLFETWNARALANAIGRLHDDPDLRRRLAAAGRVKAAEAFDREQRFADTLAILRRVADARRATSGKTAN